MFSLNFEPSMKGSEYPMNDLLSFSDLNYGEQTYLAERELSSFVAAVAQLYGSEQARLSELDWLDEADSMDTAPLPAERAWRSVTIAASVQLANRLALTPNEPNSASSN